MGLGDIPSRLENASNLLNPAVPSPSSTNLLTKAGQDSARPPGWFLKTNNQTPAQDPENPPPDAKWICTKFLEEGGITKKEYLRLCRAHALALFVAPRFCLWYLRYGSRLVSESPNTNWAKEGRWLAVLLDRVYKEKGLKAGISIYKHFCLDLRYLNQIEIPLPSEVFGSIFLTKWFWKSIPEFFIREGAQLWHS